MKLATIFQVRNKIIVNKDKTDYYNNHFKKNHQFIVNDLAVKIFKCQ